ncbi:hypothetical protein Xbed_03178 [Xenorhabdus beddingii]|uniref:Uncharacterized protein n=1 Tax=Xenorhabdus beddingii TaxID=40578 RepID=A0A1Y2SJH5_9GAMM|nr:hypothetical protein Xbed_03178 [Xenorhabdus beddingii]
MNKFITQSTGFKAETINGCNTRQNGNTGGADHA